MAAFDIRSTFVYWEQIGVFDVLLPFFLIFSITYSILQTTKVLPDPRINTLVAAIIGILFVQNQYLVGVLNSFIPNVSMVLIVILMVMLLAGVFLGEKGKKSRPLCLWGGRNNSDSICFMVFECTNWRICFRY